ATATQPRTGRVASSHPMSRRRRGAVKAPASTKAAPCVAKMVPNTRKAIKSEEPRASPCKGFPTANPTAAVAAMAAAVHQPSEVTSALRHDASNYLYGDPRQ